MFFGLRKDMYTFICRVNKRISFNTLQIFEVCLGLLFQNFKVYGPVGMQLVYAKSIRCHRNQQIALCAYSMCLTCYSKIFQ